mmetsp:Transcript_74161/g.197750  ORF Transcript_74161/g.197750 Transcript_74161/m.197750 type:complete len:203 (-) Transcript_74161:849-1457(-)
MRCLRCQGSFNWADAARISASVSCLRFDMIERRVASNTNSAKTYAMNNCPKGARIARPTRSVSLLAFGRPMEAKTIEPSRNAKAKKLVPSSYPISSSTCQSNPPELRITRYQRQPNTWHMDNTITIRRIKPTRCGTLPCVTRAAPSWSVYPDTLRYSTRPRRKNHSARSPGFDIGPEEMLHPPTTSSSVGTKDTKVSQNAKN